MRIGLPAMEFALTIGFANLSVADTMPITVRVTVRWLFSRPIPTRTLSAWRNRRTIPGPAARLGNSPRSRCCTSTTSIRSCSRDCRAWWSRSAAAHSPPTSRTGRATSTTTWRVSCEATSRDALLLLINSDNHRRCPRQLSSSIVVAAFSAIPHPID